MKHGESVGQEDAGPGVSFGFLGGTFARSIRSPLGLVPRGWRCSVSLSQLFRREKFSLSTRQFDLTVTLILTFMFVLSFVNPTLTMESSQKEVLPRSTNPNLKKSCLYFVRRGIEEGLYDASSFEARSNKPALLNGNCIVCSWKDGGCKCESQEATLLEPIYISQRDGRIRTNKTVNINDIKMNFLRHCSIFKYKPPCFEEGLIISLTWTAEDRWMMSINPHDCSSYLAFRQATQMTGPYIDNWIIPPTEESLALSIYSVITDLASESLVRGPLWTTDNDMTDIETYQFHRNDYRGWLKKTNASNRKVPPRVPVVNVKHTLDNKTKYVLNGFLDDVPSEVIDYLFDDKDRHIMHWNTLSERFSNLTIEMAVKLLLLHDRIRVNEKNGIFSHLTARKRPVHWDVNRIVNASAPPDDLWEQVLKSHYDENPHHLENKNSAQISATIERMLDYHASALRLVERPTECIPTFLKWIAKISKNDAGVFTEFSVHRNFADNSSPIGVLVYLKGLILNGISARPRPWVKSDGDARSWGTVSCEYQRIGLAGLLRARQDERKAVTSRIPEWKINLTDTQNHLLLVNSALTFYGLRRTHDFDKLDYDKLCVYMWRWCIKGKPLATPDHCILASGFSSMSSRLTSLIGEKFNSFSSELAQRIGGGLLAGIIEQAKKTLESMLGVLGPIKKLIDYAKSGLGSILGLVGLDSDNIDTSTILQLLMLWLAFVGTGSTLLKSGCVFLASHILGIYDKLVEAVTWALPMLGISVPTEVQYCDGGSTGTDIINAIYSVLRKITKPEKAKYAGIGVGIFVVLFLGHKSMDREWVRTQGGAVMSIFKNMHFIGAGIAGLSRTFAWVTAMAKAAFEWIAKQFYNEEPEEETFQAESRKLQDEIAQWISCATVLSGDDVATQINSELDVQNKVKAVYADGLKLQLRINTLLTDDNRKKIVPNTLVTAFNNAFNKFKNVHDRVSRCENYGKPRATPFHVQFVGGAGVGKTTLINKMVDEIHTTCFSNRSRDYMMYSDPGPSSEYKSGYRGQPVYYYDDMWKVLEPTLIVEYLSYISCCPMIVPMAHLDEKETYFTSPFILSTTNTPYPNVPGVACNDAVYRRRHLLVQVTTDERVLDSSDQTFSQVLFNKHYPGKSSYDFPHMKFTLLNPLDGSVKRLSEYEKNLQAAGFEMPVKDMTYKQFIGRFWTRHKQLTSEEIKKYGDFSQNVSLPIGAFDDIIDYAKKNGITDCSYFKFNNFGGSDLSDELEVDLELQPTETTINLEIPIPKYDDLITTFVCSMKVALAENHTTNCTVLEKDRGCNCGAFDSGAISDIVWDTVSKLQLLTRSEIGAYGLLLLDFIYLMHKCPAARQSLFGMMETIVKIGPGIAETIDDNSSLIALERKYWQSANSSIPGAGSVDWIFADSTLNALLTISDYEEKHRETMLSVMRWYRYLVARKVIKPFDETNFSRFGDVATTPMDFCTRVHFNFVDLPTDDFKDVTLEEILSRHLQLVSATSEDENARDDALCKFEGALLTHVTGTMDFSELENNVKRRMEMIELISGDTENERYAIHRLTKLFKMTTAYPDIKDPFTLRWRITNEASRFHRLDKNKKARYDWGRVSGGTAPSYVHGLSDMNVEYDGEMYAPIYTYAKNGPAWDIAKKYENTEWFRMLRESIELIERVNPLNHVYVSLTHRACKKLMANDLDDLDKRIRISVNTLKLLKKIEIRDNGLKFWTWGVSLRKFRELLMKVIQMFEVHMKEEHIVSLVPYVFMCAQKLREEMAVLARLPPRVIDWMMTVSVLKNNAVNFYERLVGELRRIRNNPVQRLLDGVRATGATVWKFITGCGWWLKVLVPFIGLVAAIMTISNYFLFPNTKKEDHTSRITVKSKSAPQQPRPLTHCNRIVNDPERFGRYTRTATVGNSHCTIVLLGQSYILVPYHSIRPYCLPGKEETFKLKFVPTFNFGLAWEFTVLPSDVYVFEKTDSAVIRLNSLTPQRDFTKFLVTRAQLAEIGQPPRITAVYREVTSIERDGVSLQTVECRDTGPRYDNVLERDYDCVIECSGQWTKGSSGAPCFTNNPIFDTQDKMVGNVSYNMGGMCYLTTFTAEDMDEAVDHFEKKYASIYTHVEPVHCNLDATPRSLKVVENATHIEVLGRATKPIGSPINSSILPSPISKHLPPSLRIPAILNPRDERVSIHPLRHSLTKSGRDVTLDFPDDVCTIARRWMVQDIKEQLNRVNGGKKLRVFDLYTSIVGTRTPGSEPIKTNTSPGIPWIWDKTARGKQTWIRANEDGSYEFDGVVASEYNRIYDSLREGEVPADLMMYDIAKDELRPRDKAIGPPPKTRSITVDNMIVGLIYRSLFHDLERCLHLAGDGRYEFLPGLDITGRDGIVLHRRLSRFSKGIDLDVGNWDGHFTKQMYDNVVQIVNRLYTHDYDYEPNALARRAIAQHWCFAKVQWQDLVYQKCRGLPSGAAGTTLFNTLGHQFISMVIYIMLCREHDREYLISLACYRDRSENGFHGDDRITTISDSIIDFYNGGTIAQKYVQHGFPVTSATSKTSGVEDFKPFYDCTILKRSPVHIHKHLFDVVWKLDANVLFDLCVYVRKTPNENKQFAVNLYLALEGMCRHGKSAYDQFVLQINRALTRAGYKPIILSWEELLAHDRFRVLGAFANDEVIHGESVLRERYNEWLETLPSEF